MLANLQNVLRQNTAHTELPQQVFVEAIEAALLAAARRVYGANADVSVEINLDASEIRCYVPKKVVNIMRDFLKEIPIDTARKLHAGAELGQTLEVEINPMEFGRIPAQLARQILRQKIKEAEREKIYDEFEGREGELVTGHVQRFERRGIILDLERTEAFLPLREVAPGHSYERGRRLQCLILQVREANRGAPIVVSRTDKNLIQVLFEQEVPEIFEGQVQIVEIARDPGKRSKVAVTAVEESIDAVGTCVGVKGVRVRSIVAELDDEKIDLVEWSDDPRVFIGNALCPATVSRVELNEAARNARVIVPDNQLSLAIGRRGQNARLAAKLTGWKIDIKSESEAVVSIDELFKPAALQDVGEEGVAAGAEIFSDAPAVHSGPGEAMLTEADAPVAETALLQEEETDEEARPLSQEAMFAAEEPVLGVEAVEPELTATAADEVPAPVVEDDRPESSGEHAETAPAVSSEGVELEAIAALSVEEFDTAEEPVLGVEAVEPELTATAADEAPAPVVEDDRPESSGEHAETAPAVSSEGVELEAIAALSVEEFDEECDEEIP